MDSFVTASFVERSTLGSVSRLESGQTCLSWKTGLQPRCCGLESGPSPSSRHYSKHSGRDSS